MGGHPTLRFAEAVVSRTHKIGRSLNSQRQPLFSSGRPTANVIIYLDQFHDIEAFESCLINFLDCGSIEWRRADVSST